MTARRPRRRRPTVQTPLPRRKSARKPQKTGGLRWYHKIGIAAGTVFLALVLYTWLVLPSVGDASELSFAESTVIYDRGALDPTNDPTEHVLYVIHGDENREFLPLEEISPWVPAATIAIEDDRFYRHLGFDIRGITKAALHEIFGIGSKRGGSTITQQLVKNTFLSRERSYTRKFKEILLSVKMELVYSKKEILEMYLNKIPYGNNAHGIEAAAQTFFGKSARDLTLAEASVLASLPARPTYFSPYGANKTLLLGFYEYDDVTGEQVYKKGRKDLVLQRMLDTGEITFEEFQTAFSESKNLIFTANRTDIRAPHFVFHVRQQLEDKFGKEFLKNGGLRIYTTLDPELQNIAEETIEAKSAHYSATYRANNVAMVSINPDDGQVLAYVGGKDYFDIENDGQVDVLTSLRQPGSSFKPLVYATGFEQGFSPSTVLFDVETDFGGNYTPQNFDGEFSGPVAARDSINQSLNIPAIKMAYLATPNKIFENAKKLGIPIEGDAEMHGVAIGIGVAEVEPLWHINSYQAFARGGDWYEPTTILEIRSSNGKLLEKFDPTKTLHDGIDPEAAALVRNVLTDETTRPSTPYPTDDDPDGMFDWNELLQLDDLDNGAKTGTSNRHVDNPDFDKEKPEDDEENPKKVTAPGDSWTIGFTPHLVTGVWVGNNRGEPMKPGATGMTVAAPIWKKFMNSAHETLIERGADPEKKYFDIPLETRKINKFSGRLASDVTPKDLVREEFFASYSVPIELDQSVKKVAFDTITGRRASTFTPSNSRTEKWILDLQSARPDMPNWEEPVQEWIHDNPRFMSSLGAARDPKNDKKTDLTDFLPRSRTQLQLSQNPTQLSFNNPPVIRITSPRDRGTIAPGTIEVTVEATAKNGVREVDFYFNDELITYTTRRPWSQTFKIPESLASGSAHLLRVVAIDNKLQTGSDEIQVKIAPDTVGPEIVFLGPIPNQKIPINAHIEVLVDVKDHASSVRAVEFLLDGESLEFDQEAPFQTSIISPAEPTRANLTVRAWDTHSNSNERSVPLQIVRQRMLDDHQPVIDTYKSYRQSVSVDVLVPHSETVAWIELVARRGQEELFRKRVEKPGQFSQFQVPRDMNGAAEIVLHTMFNGDTSPTENSKKTINL